MSDLLFFLCHLRRTNIALFKSLSVSGKGNENKMRKCIWSLKLLTTHSRRLPLKWLQVRSHHEHRGRERHRRRRGGSRELQLRHSACPSVQGVVVRTSARASVCWSEEEERIEKWCERLEKCKWRGKGAKLMNNTGAGALNRRPNRFTPSKLYLSVLCLFRSLVYFYS